MKLISYRRLASVQARAGLLKGNHVIDIERAFSSPPDMLALLQSTLDFELGSTWTTDVEKLGKAVPGALIDPTDVVLGPILTNPPSIRDFYAFEDHVKNARARRGLEMIAEWYAIPVFYFS